MQMCYIRQKDTGESMSMKVASHSHTHRTERERERETELNTHTYKRDPLYTNTQNTINS